MDFKRPIEERNYSWLSGILKEAESEEREMDEEGQN